MGTAATKSRKKKKSLSQFSPLGFYETSNQDLAFGREHIEAIYNSLQIIKLQMMAEIILEYLGQSKDANNKFICWNHPNYTTFIHTKGTPLDGKFKPPNFKDMSDDPVMYRIVMMGARGVGKSSLTIRFAMDCFLEDYDQTIEDSYRQQIALNVAKNEYDCRVKSNEAGYVVLNILDAAGIAVYVYEYDLYIPHGQIFLLVFDVVNAETFDKIKLLRERILREKDEDNYPVIAVGNKCDLRVNGGCSGVEVDMNAVHDWCEQHQIPYIETSAKNGKNVNFLFRHCVFEYEMWLRRHRR